MAKPDEETDKEAPGAPAKRDRRKLIAIVAAALIVLAAAGAGAWFMLSGNQAAKEDAEESTSKADAPKDAASKVFVDVEPMVVNLRTTDGAAHYLKLHFVVVAGKGISEPELKAQLPVLIDSFQPFLRELRPDDLAGSAAVFRIKEELRVRAAAALGPDAVDDILIQDLIQE